MVCDLPQLENALLAYKKASILMQPMIAYSLQKNQSV